MSFLSDQATNPLARFTWGIEPRNSSRRRRAWLAVCFPTAVYCLLLALMSFEFMPIYTVFGAELSSLWRDPAALAALAILSSIYAMPCLLVISILVRSFRVGPAHSLRANWPDYRLAGLTGRQMLRGLSGPGIVGLFAAAAFHLALYAVCILVFARYDDSGADIWIFILVGLASAFGFILYPYLDVALWVLMPAFLTSLITTVAITIASSPLMVFVLFFYTGNFETAPVVTEVVSWPVRILVVRWLWLRAIRRLDAPLPASSDSGLGA